jgi:hypothetical protein
MKLQFMFIDIIIITIIIINTCSTINLSCLGTLHAGTVSHYYVIVVLELHIYIYIYIYIYYCFTKQSSADFCAETRQRCRDKIPVQFLDMMEYS